VITGELPERNGEFEYQVACVVRESELIGATYGCDIETASACAFATIHQNSSADRGR
jgi:hypothetical protein